MTAMAYPLEPSADQMREMGTAAVDYVTEFIGALPDAPANGSLEDALEVAATLHGPPPEMGEPFAQVLGDVARGADHALEPAGPGYLAYIPGGGLYSAALASFLASGINRFTNLAATAPVFVQMEADVLRWLCDLFGLGPASGGILTTGGSMANLSAIVTARAARLPADFLAGTIYVSEQAHASVAKAAKIAGFPEANVVRVAVTRQLRMDVDGLADAIRRDRAAGRTPFCVVANAGTTNTGAVDPIQDLADLCEREDLWLHVDAAYGGFFQLTERGRERFRGIERADSITLDPHKGMFLPYGTGSLIVRDASLLRDAHSTSGADYLQDLVAGGEVLPSFAEYSPGAVARLPRPARVAAAAPAWCPGLPRRPGGEAGSGRTRSRSTGRGPAARRSMASGPVDRRVPAGAGRVRRSRRGRSRPARADQPVRARVLVEHARGRGVRAPDGHPVAADPSRSDRRGDRHHSPGGEGGADFLAAASGAVIVGPLDSSGTAARTAQAGPRRARRRGNTEVADAPSDVAISLVDVTKRFPNADRDAVGGFSLDIHKGQITALIGPSGCGKTTTLKMINRLIEPTSGRILLEGTNVLEQDPVQLRRRIGYVIQTVGLLPHRTIADNIGTVPRLLGWDRDRIAVRVREMAELFELDDDLLARYPGELSGGQRQRVGVARALAADPDVMLMDEPFAAVDPIVRGRLQEEFLSIQERLRKTIVFVTHDIDEAIKLSDRIALLNVGAVLEQYAPPEQMLREPANAFVEEFLGNERGLKRLALVKVGDIGVEEGPVVAPSATVEEARAVMRSFEGDWASVVDGSELLRVDRGISARRGCPRRGRDAEPVLGVRDRR